MKLENQFLSIEIAEYGAELTRIFDRVSGEERLWNADAAFWKRSSPVLFPNVGKVYGGIMHTPNGDCKLGQHGFARDMDFSCAEAGENYAVYELKANAESRQRYPYDFVLRIKYELNGHDIGVHWHVENAGDGEMPFTIGGHPAFIFRPGHPNKEEYSIRIPGKKQLTFKLLDPAWGCAVNEEHTIDLCGGYLQLTEELFAHDALICDGGQIEEAWLCDADRKPLVGLKAKGFPNFGIWSVKDAPFVCLEPWHGRCDNVGFVGMYGEKDNAVVLKQGKSFDISYCITIA